MSKTGHEKNRAAWNDMARVHYEHPDYKLNEFLDGWNSIKSIDKEFVGDVNGKKLLHLMCQFGMDTLSWGRYGAKVTGVDISHQSIEYAKQIKKQIGLDEAQFVRSDVVELIGKIDDKFDIVYQSYGTLCWIGDVKKWAEVVAHYIADDGFFFIIDDHPLACPMLYNYSYFKKDPDIEVNTPDYCDREYIIKKELVEWQHTMADIVNALISSGLKIDCLQEYDKSYYDIEADWVKEGDYYYPPGGPFNYPLMFALKASK